MESRGEIKRLVLVLTAAMRADVVGIAVALQIAHKDLLNALPADQASVNAPPANNISSNDAFTAGCARAFPPDNSI